MGEVKELEGIGDEDELDQVSEEEGAHVSHIVREVFDYLIPGIVKRQITSRKTQTILLRIF